MVVKIAVVVLISATCMFAPSLHGQTAYPMLMSLKPVAAQIGQTSEHTLHSRHSMVGAYQVIVTGEGVKGEIIAKEADEGRSGERRRGRRKRDVENLRLRFSVEPSARPGVRDFRIVTPNGVSTVGQLVIASDAVIVEKDKNDSPDQALAVSIPATLCGAIEKAEDVDYFKFHVEAGTSFSFHVRAQRLQDRIHDLQTHVDPIITLRSASGATLAASDNVFYADPLLNYRFEQAGDYLLEIRDVRYQGNNFWDYCVEVTDRPFVTNVFPMAVARGQEQQLQLVGYQVPSDFVSPIKLPMDIPVGPRWESFPMGAVSTNPAPILVTEIAPLIEPSIPNNDVASATAITVPGEVSGRIETEADIDFYAFDAKKGDRFSFDLIARRQQSQLDSHLRILDDKGNPLALNDDLSLANTVSSDSQLEDWTAPADGRFIIEIRDLHLRGGAGYIYHLRIERSRPYFHLMIDTDKTLLTPGTGNVIYVRAIRKNGFQGPIDLQIADLPHGVTATCGRILEKGQDGCIVLWTDHDAPMSARNVRITGVGTHKVSDTETLSTTASATPLQETYLPGGGRGHWPVEIHTVNVGTPSDLRAVVLDTYDIRLKPGESKTIKVNLVRADGFDKNVMLDVTYNHLGSIYGNSLPPGITLDGKNSQTLLTGTNSVGSITLTAAADAAPSERQLFAVMANISINFVMKTTYSSMPVTITIEK